LARAYVLAVVLAVGGCSGSEIVQNLAPAAAPELAPPNYRRIVADNIKVIFPAQTSLGDVEISGVRPVDHLKGPAWVTCLKVVVRDTPQHFAVFIQGDKVIDWRGGIVIGILPMVGVPGRALLQPSLGCAVPAEWAMRRWQLRGHTWCQHCQ